MNLRSITTGLLVLLSVLVCIAIGVYVVLNNPSAKPNELSTPTPVTPWEWDGATITPQPNVQNGYDSVSEPHNTPPPDFPATQRALDAAISDHESKVAEQAKRVTTTAEALAVAHAVELHNLSVQYETIKLSGAISEFDFEDTLRQEVITSTRAMTTVQVGRESEHLLGLNIIDWIWIGGLKFAGLFVIGIVVGGALYFLIDNTRTEKAAGLDERRRQNEDERHAIAIQEAANEKAVRLAALYRFVCDAIEVNGAEDHQVPANTKLDGWNADRWTGAVNILKTDGMALTTNQGTFLKQGDLGELRNALENGEYPYPTGGADAAKSRFEQGTPK